MPHPLSSLAASPHFSPPCGSPSTPIKRSLHGVTQTLFHWIEQGFQSVKKGMKESLSFVGKGFQGCLPTHWFSLLSRWRAQLRDALPVRTQPYFSSITPLLYLGGMPLSNYGHLQTLKSLGIKSVLAVSEKKEFSPGPWSHPIQPRQWAEKNILFHQLHQRDLEPLSMENIAMGVGFISEQVKQGKATYIHCNVGKGRSVSLLLAYLCKKNGDSLSSALQKIQAKRPQASPNEEQLEAVSDYLSVFAT